MDKHKKYQEIHNILAKFFGTKQYLVKKSENLTKTLNFIKKGLGES